MRVLGAVARVTGRACRLFPRALGRWPPDLCHEDSLGLGDGWEVLVLVGGWFPNWATAAASSKSHCKGGSDRWHLPDGKPGQLPLSGDRILQRLLPGLQCCASPGAALEETGLWSLSSEEFSKAP